MSTYTIGEVAERSGFAASTLRYYEGIGLVPAAGRSDAGYRLYDDHTLSRLAFVARAKELGCSLDEIADLAAVWDGDECAPVQRRFHELITAKIADAERQLTSLRTFTEQLRAAARQLAGPPIDGTCGDGCACLGGGAETPPPLPIACKLDDSALRARIREWEAMLSQATRRVRTDADGWRIEFGAAVSPVELAALITAEHACCEFLSFAITIDERGLGLEVKAPDGAGDLVAALFERPS